MKQPVLIAVPFILVLIFLKGGYSEDPPGIIPGGISHENKPVTPEVKQLVRAIQPQIKTHLQGVPGGLNVIGRVKPLSYKTQLVNGVNYFVKVRARTPNKNVFYHLRIFQGFGKNETARLEKVEGPKRKRDVINYF